MLLLLACAPTAELTTTEGSAFGHWIAEVRVDEPVEAVFVGEARGYDLVQADGLLRFTVQGGVGEQVVTLHQGEDILEAGTLTYHPATDPLFDRVTGIGASLTMGVQDGVPTQHAQLMSPGAQIARAAGAYYGIPLLVEPLFPTIEPTDLGPAPDCSAPGVAKHVTDGVIEVLGVLNDDDGDFRYDFGRVDPDLVVQNAGVGGFQVGDLTTGTDEFTKGFLAHLVLDPYGDLDGEIAISQVEHVLAQDPTLVVSFDTYGNDLIGSVVLADEIDVGNITSEEAFHSALDRLLPMLGDSDAQVFLANSPRPGLLPAGRLVVEEAEDREAAQAALDEADAIAILYNDILAERAQDYDNIYIVDAWGLAEELSTNGMTVDGQFLTTERFGGLLSLDGVHFTDTGYATFAQLFLDTIEAELGVAVDPLDLQAIVAADARSPLALEASGVPIEDCWR